MIVNEVGEIDIDSRLLVRDDGETVQLSNGCVCCSVRLDLAKAVHGLATKRGPDGAGFGAILIETTGVADPAPVIQTFQNIPDLRRVAQLDSIVTVADCEHLAGQLAAEEVAQSQIALADFVVLNKTDLASPAAIAEAEQAVRILNPAAEVIRAEFGRVEWRRIIDAGAFDISARIEADPRLLDELRRSGHKGISSVAFRFDRPFLLEPFAEFIEEISRTARIYRSKGFLHVEGQRRKAVFHGVNSRFNVFWSEPWPPGAKRASELVFIGRDFDPAALKAGLESCLGGRP